MKIPEPMMPPMTIIVASKAFNRRASVVTAVTLRDGPESKHAEAVMRMFRRLVLIGFVVTQLRGYGGFAAYAAPEPRNLATPQPAPQPFSLSDPDGQELIIEELNVHTAIHGMLSLTELELRFRNPQAK